MLVRGASQVRLGQLSVVHCTSYQNQSASGWSIDKLSDPHVTVHVHHVNGINPIPPGGGGGAESARTDFNF